MQKLNGYFKLNKVKISFLFVGILILSAQLNAQEIPNELLKSISNYNIGDDRSELTKVNQIVVEALTNENKRASVETELIQFFKSDVTFDAKQFASRQLRIAGTEKTANELKDYITDEKLSDLARYAIEEIQSSLVDDLLIDALGKTSSKTQIGIINSLGFRKTVKAAQPISNLIDDNNSDLSIAAASALGEIGSDKCILYLSKHLNDKDIQLRNVAFDSYLNCIDNLFNQNRFENAYDAYNEIYQNKIASFTVKQAALKGIINSSKNIEEEILTRIKNEPDELKSIPISKIRDLDKINELSEFADLLNDLNPANQIQLLGIFEEIGDKEIKSKILPLLNSDTELVRIAAIKTLSTIGDKTDVINLAKIAADKSGTEADAALNSLNLLNNNGVDDEIISRINSSDENIKIILIESVGIRGISSALNQMLALTKSENRLVRNEAFKTIGEIASLNNIDKLINILEQQNDNSDKRKVEYTITTIMKKYEPSENHTQIIISSFQKSENVNDKSSFLRILGQTKSENAYNILVNEINNNNTEIKIAAITGLSMWQNAKPRELLLTTAQNSNDEVQSAALKGFTNFIEMDSDLSVQQKVELYKKSLELAKTSNEKNIALDAIGHLDTFESLDVIKNYINQSDVKETVDNGINRVSWHLFPTNPERVKEYVKYFLSQIKDEKFQTKNNELLNAIDRYVERNK